MNSIDRLIYSNYRYGLRLFPRDFRDRNAEQMLQPVLDACHDPSVGRYSFCWTLFVDLIQSCIKEHLAMLPERIGNTPSLFMPLGLDYF